MPHGRHLGGRDHRVVYNVDWRLPGESQPPVQLEATPITKYASDPGLVLGRQIAVNRTYICYGLKLGAIQVLNINTALRSLLRGHTQRVTDMAFFDEDVDLLASASVDGRFFVWMINEEPDDEDKPLITGKIIVALQIVGYGEAYHPRICWHPCYKEILIVGIGNSVLKIDTTKVGRGKEFSAEEPLQCPMDKLIDGVQLIENYDGEVTDLSISLWMLTRLVSASKDGMVKVCNVRTMMPIATLRPHDGQPVNCVSFLPASHRPDHIVLITAGPLNREVKIWTSAALKGWVLCNDSESWDCIQTLELRSSSEPRVDQAFFNQVVVLPHSNFLLLANVKKNAIYAVHVDYGPYPAATRMDYITDFTVEMPILSLIGRRDFFSDVEQIVQVYCVQTQAIQRYALDLSQCLPPTVETMESGKEPSLPHVSDMSISEGFIVVEPSCGLGVSDLPVGSGLPNPPLSVSNSEAPLHPVASDASESGSGQHAEFYIEAQVVSEIKEKPLSSQASEAKIEMDKECSTLRTETNSLEEVQSHPVDDVAIIEALEQASNIGDEGIQECMKDMPVKASEASLDTTSQSLSITKGKKQKGKLSQSSIPSPPSSSPFNSMESFDEQGIVSSAPSIDIAISKIQSMHESLSQLYSKHEKVERDRLQQLTDLNSNYMNKELPAILERALKKEISAVGPVLAHTITPFIEKTISSAIVDSFQDALWLTLQSSVIPVFEHSCKSKFEQVDAAFQKWMAEHTVAAQQQFESTHTPLVLTLTDAINSASSMVHYLTTELADAHQRLGLGTSGNTNAPNPMAMQQSNSPGIVPEMNALPVEPPIDPKNELTRLIFERKYEEAFILALNWSDPTIVSWLCSQFDARTIHSMVPPLSQMVLLSLLLRLTSNVRNETSRKLGWIKEVAAVINPTDPLISMLVRPTLEQVYNTMTDITTTSGDVVDFVLSRL